jgi:hypothetical protein
MPIGDDHFFEEVFGLFRNVVVVQPSQHGEAVMHSRRQAQMDGFLFQAHVAPLGERAANPDLVKWSVLTPAILKKGFAMKTVRITCETEGQAFDIDGQRVELKGHSETAIPVDLWMATKRKRGTHPHLKNGLIYATSKAEEAEAEAEFNAECFREFERHGFPAVKALQDSGGIKSSVKSSLASEWLTAHSEGREESFLSEAKRSNILNEAALSEAKKANLLAEDALSEAKKANLLAEAANSEAKKANRLALCALITAAIAATEMIARLIARWIGT